MIQQYVYPFLSTYYPYFLVGFVGALIFYFLKDYFKLIYKEIGKVIYDTLKIRDTYSRTSITMFASFLLATIYALYDIFKVGFKFEVFLTYMLVATGIKITDAFSKKLTGQVFKDAKEGIELKEEGSHPEDCPEEEDEKKKDTE